jgi:hypothetical protein
VRYSDYSLAIELMRKKEKDDEITIVKILGFELLLEIEIQPRNGRQLS